MEALWRVKRPDEKKQKQLARKLGISLPIAGVLLNRGVEDLEEAEAFLKPRPEHIKDIKSLPDGEKALRRFHHAIAKKERIAIYSDYDADGLCSSAILARFLSLCGYTHDDKHEHQLSFSIYIPHRRREGYGVHRDAVEKIARGGTDLLVCLDCGVGAVDAIGRAKELGIDTIVLDHHEPSSDVPCAFALVDPKVIGGLSKPVELTASGLAVKFVMSLILRLFPSSKNKLGQFIRDIFALSAVGTIADVAPLTGENRPIAYYGLRALRQTSLQGLKAIMEVASIQGKPLKSYDVAFKIAPRLNAASRVETAENALELLLTDSPERAIELAQLLDRLNRERQREQRAMLDEALGQIEKPELEPLVAVWKEGWNPGVAGLVASKLVERYYRPALVIGIEDGLGRGSARSVPSVNIHDAIAKVSSHLIEFGGHGSAAGLTIKQENIEVFVKALKASILEQSSVEEMIPELEIDGEVTLSFVNGGFVREIERLEPFGEGNREPLFCASDVSLVGINPTSTGEHLRFQVVQGRSCLGAIAFSTAHRYEELLRARSFSIAFVPFISQWSGEVELKVKEIRVEK